MFEVAQQLQVLNVWDHYQVDVGTILATKSMLVDIVQWNIEVESEMRAKLPFKTPILTKFSGIEPVPKGEDSYE